MNKSPKLVCKNVWKLYGDKPKEFLQIHNNNPDKKTIEAGDIATLVSAIVWLLLVLFILILIIMLTFFHYKIFTSVKNYLTS